jgi:hypothetical protein
LRCIRGVAGSANRYGAGRNLAAIFDVHLAAVLVTSTHDEPYGAVHLSLIDRDLAKVCAGSDIDGAGGRNNARGVNIERGCAST